MLKHFLWLPLVLLVPLAAGCQWDQNARAADALGVPVGYEVGRRAPEFNLLSVGQGHSVRLSELKGRPVIINFFCGCNMCSLVGKEWVKNRDNLGDVALVSVVTNHWSYAPAAVRDFRARTGWSWPMLADMAGDTATDYHAPTCPRLFVVDARGVILYVSPEGASDEQQLVADALAAAHGRRAAGSTEGNR